MRFTIDRASLTVGSKFIVFPLFYFVFEGNFPSTSPWGGSYLEGRFNGGFFASPVWGAYILRAYFRNFTVCNTEDADVPSKHVWKIKESCYVHTTIYIVAAI